MPGACIHHIRPKSWGSYGMQDSNNGTSVGGEQVQVRDNELAYGPAIQPPFSPTLECLLQSTHWLVVCGNPLTQLCFDFRVLRISCEVAPFPLVVSVVVQLF